MEHNSALVVKTADSDIIGVVLKLTRHEKVVKMYVEDLIQSYTGGVHAIEYNPEEIEYTAINIDGERQTFYVEEVEVI